MPKIDLGGKQICPACGSKFYDLHKRPAACPKCGNVFDPDDETIKAKRIRSRLNVVEPEETEDDEEIVIVKKTVDAEDDEDTDVEVTPEIDVEADEPPLVLGDDEDDSATPVPDEALPDGFAEADLDVPPEDDDDDVPFLDDDDDADVDDIDDLPDEDDPDLR